MRFSDLHTSLALLLLSTALLPGFARAEPVDRVAAPLAAESEGLAEFGAFYLSANAAVVTEYRFRGLRLSGSNPAVQGGLDIDHLSGFYAGAFVSTLDSATLGHGGAELDLYAGWSGPVAEGLRADAGVIAYLYPDAPAGSGAGDFDWVELYGSLTYTLGPGSLRVGAAWDVGEDGLAFVGPDGNGLRRGNLYLYTDLRAGVPGSDLTLTALAGYTTGQSGIGAAGPAGSASFNWSLGAEMPLAGPLSLGVAYVDAAGGGVGAGGGFDPTAGSVVGTLRASF